MSPHKSSEQNFTRLLIAFFILSIYTLLLWGRVPYITSLASAYLTFMKKLIGLELSHYPFWVVLSGIHIFLVPMIFGRIILRIPFKRMGFRWISWRQVKIVFLLYLCALPFLIYLGTRESMWHFYESYLEMGTWQFILWSNLLLAIEHSSLQGILISIMAPHFFNTSRDKGREGVDQVGTGLRHRRNAITNWLRIDWYYGIVLLLDGVLFMLIHVGKPIHEIGFSFPGGVFLAFLALKFRSFLPCYLIHTLTAGTIILLIILLH